MSRLFHLGFADRFSGATRRTGVTVRKLASGAAVALVLAANAAPASAAAMGSGSFILRLTVPVSCRVSYTAGGAAAVSSTGGAAADEPGGAVDLGQIGEYCNDGSGYSVVVDYSPGTLKGAVLQLGGDRVVLDGSGEATISQSQEARIRQRELVAIPGANGFDSPELQFNIKPTPI